MNEKSKMTPEEMKSLKKTIAIRFSLLPVVLGLLILFPAGTLLYCEFYVYLTVLVVPMIFVLLYFLERDPKFLERRMRAKEKEKQQKLLVLLMTPVFLAAFIIPGLDHRFSWSEVPTYLVIAADILVLSGYLMIFLVFKENSYASRIVETHENQKVITTGLYGVVRHPMYLGLLIMYLPTSIALGSYWGVIPFVSVFPIVLVLRILNEEKVLSDNLPGYKEYCQKLRFRLIPHIW